MIVKKKLEMRKLMHSELLENANEAYRMEIQRLRYTYKYLKRQTKQKDILLK